MAVAIAWGLCIVWSCDCGATFSVTTRRRHDVTSLSRSVDKVTFYTSPPPPPLSTFMTSYRFTARRVDFAACRRCETFYMAGGVSGNFSAAPFMASSSIRDRYNFVFFSPLFWCMQCKSRRLDCGNCLWLKLQGGPCNCMVVTFYSG